MSIYIPGLYLPIAALAEARSIEYAKLNKGLGLEQMALADAYEDAASMAANAVLQLIRQNKLDPRQIGRIYMGTESAVDGSKPMASYVLQMLSEVLHPIYGADCFLNCDVVDLTFACIGSVDALQNTLDWVKAGNDRIGIVVGSDIAKYELQSTGEYTQGAGAVALLVKENPRLMAISDHWGVASKGVHDFFKPFRQVSKKQLATEILELARNKNNDTKLHELLERIEGELNLEALLDEREEQLSIHKETPVFDGPYSNDCYRERIGEALNHFIRFSAYHENEPIIPHWEQLIFHLPYAFQARRMFTELFVNELIKYGSLGELEKQLSTSFPQEENFQSFDLYNDAYQNFLKLTGKSPIYKEFVASKIAKSEWASSRLGNLYTSSIFLALMAGLERALLNNEDLQSKKFGFFAYGSGSKSKVFEGTLQPGWEEIAGKFEITKRLDARKELDYHTYEKLHNGVIDSVLPPAVHTFHLSAVCKEKGALEGARTYSYKNPVKKNVLV